MDRLSVLVGRAVQNAYEINTKFGLATDADFGGTTVILIGSFDIARDLLDKRANIYSTRPRAVSAFAQSLEETTKDSRSWQVS